MGCANCANNTANGLPPGCRNNGACKNGCDVKMHVFDWLSNMELPAEQKPFDLIEVRFKENRKGFFKNIHDLSVHRGDTVVVEGSPGADVGVVSLTGELVRAQMNKKGTDPNTAEFRRLYRKAKREDLDRWREARAQEEEAKTLAREVARDQSLNMKISDVEYQGDGRKATFYYTADKRVDFREMIKVLADRLKIRIEMRQIGARQEAGRIGGIGDCGRELCCSTWLSDFRTVSTNAARYQRLSLNPQKLAGQCGKLKCCLNYELDMYLEAIQDFPDSKAKLHTEKGTAFAMKSDIFKRQIWYLYEGEVGGAPVALSVERVKEVIAMNEKGQKPADLVDHVAEEPAPNPDLLAQESVTRFDNGKKKSKKKKKSGSKNFKGKGKKDNNAGGPAKKKGPRSRKGGGPRKN